MLTKALVLYSATKFDPQRSWITTLDIDKQDPLTAYNYSFYFTVTTIMTVGYGDITPKNRAEITIVCLVQIFGIFSVHSGIIMFGYMINQIGYCISSLRKSRESIDRDLFVVEKLRQHYRMNDDLTEKVRSYLVDAKPKLDQVLPEEEKGILMKLNEEIREGTRKLIQICKDKTWPQSLGLQYSLSAGGLSIFKKPFLIISYISWLIPTICSINLAGGNGFT